jgi:superfamily II DNA or RNA helicase
MSPDAPPLVDARDIVRLVGPAAYQRALSYAKGGAVTEIQWDADSGLLSSTVRGSSALPYRCHIELAPGRAGFERPVSGNCSCPMMRDCKHVAATLLECNAANVKSSGQRASDLVTTKPEPQAEVVPEPVLTGWKSAMAALTGAPGGASAGASATPLALQFELRMQMPRTRDRWRGPTAATATTRVPGGEYRLGVRPAIRSAAGNWVRGNVTWNSLGFQAHRLELRSEHQRWFAQFVALYRATTRDVYTGQDVDWLYLEEFHSPLLWEMLDDAARLDIELIGGKKDATVTVGSRARLTLDAVRSDDGVTLAPRLDLDGLPLPVAEAGAVGDHGVYVASLSPSRIVLAPTAGVLTADRLRLLGQQPLEVPAAELDEFFTEYYPRLSRSVDVTSADRSVELPQLVPPVLVLTVTFGKKQTIKLLWNWEYVQGTGTIRLPLAGHEEARDRATEAATLAAVHGLLETPATLQGLAAAEFAATVLPRIEAVEGVRVDEVGERPDYRELTEVPKLKVTTVETDQRDWFDLGVHVSIDGRKVPFAPLFAALTKGAKKLLLVDNSYLSLEQPVFDELKRLIDEASTLAEWETGPRISRYQASLWGEFEDLADETEQAVSWRATVSQLASLEAVEPTPLPASLVATLRPYQQQGFDWLAFLWQHGLGGILADDMGLGKTLQTLALVAHARLALHGSEGQDAPFLVVAPTSVVSNWASEAERFTPGLVVRAITATEGKSRTTLSESARGADLVVTSYALFRLDFDAYQRENWAGLVLDEAQFVKNPASKAHQAAVDLRTPFKLAITGTPMENSLVDLWSLFAITAPGLFASSRRFTDDYVKPITYVPAANSHPSEGERAAATLARLRKRIRPLMMRRTKELVATELPAKQEQVLRVDLAPKHRTLYDAFLQRERQKLLGLIDDLDKNRFIVFRSLTLLRMLALDATLIDPELYAGIPSSKLDALFENLEDVVAEGHRALVFSQFTTFLRKAADRMDEKGIAYEYLDGATTRRADVIKRFKKGDAPVFLISLKAGGFGLNLTEADYVFLLDPWWNPATETQAVDRTHRIGQTKSVNVYRMVASGTIEDKVMALKEKKARLFDAVMDEDAVFSSALTADDIRALLE